MRTDLEIKEEIASILAMVKEKRGLGITIILLNTLIALEWIEGNPVSPSERLKELINKGGMKYEN